jgi:hypothetical protein
MNATLYKGGEYSAIGGLADVFYFFLPGNFNRIFSYSPRSDINGQHLGLEEIWRKSPAIFFASPAANGASPHYCCFG